MNARDYQRECQECIRAQFRKGKRRVLVEAATGAGKTIIFSMIADLARAKNGKTLILCNRDNLVKQAAEKYKRVTGDFPSVEKAEERGSRSSPVVIGSIQTMQKERLAGWNPDHFSIVITDEVHGATAPTFKAVLNHFGQAWHVGFSATVERADGQGVGWFYEECKGPYAPFAFRKGVFDLIEDGWLVPLQFLKIPVPVTLDEKIATKKVLTESEEEFALAPYVEKLIHALGDMIKDSKSLAFFAECKASMAAAQYLSQIGIHARHVQGAGRSTAGLMHEWEKEDVMQWFDKAERGSCMTNASLLTTGYDCPTLDTVAIVRLIKSTPLWTQIVGRVTRPVAPVDMFDTATERKAAIAASVKPFGRILDLLIQGDSHNIAQPSCLISTLKSEQKAIAQKLGNFAQQTDIQILKAALNEVKIDDKNEALRKTANAAANAAAKMGEASDVYIGDILRAYNPTHKPAPGWAISKARRLGANIPQGPLSGYQVFRIIERIEGKVRKKITA